MFCVEVQYITMEEYLIEVYHIEVYIIGKGAGEVSGLPTFKS
jgi:hypothetical protein